MSRAHFDAGSSEHEKPLYQTHLGEASPMAGEDYHVGPALNPDTELSPKAFISKTGHHYNTSVTENYGGDFEVQVHPGVRAWQSNLSQDDGGTHAFDAPPQHRRSLPTQGTLIRPKGSQHLESVAETSVETSDPMLENEGDMYDAVHVGMIHTDREHRGRGLAMHMLRTSQQFAESQGRQLVADHQRSDMGTSLGRKAAQEDPFIQNEHGDYLTEEKNLRTISPVGNSNIHDVRADAVNGGSDAVKQKSAEEGTKARAAIKKQSMAAVAGLHARKSATQGNLFPDHVVIVDWDQPRGKDGRTPRALALKGSEAHLRSKQGLSGRIR